ncbi:RraA family protein [Microbacterium sp. CFBP9034]|uniref:RraA family protein n=1 Tax=Microbacterium sp. CFBP9034 TaxID=3096540 RepID=UPI002A6AC24E|nr:RraA family protein [Microbacterium sp. CFBP9034]MDY0908221.1 RraA family protein [Microbacterium sp. CFBP9034]
MSSAETRGFFPLPGDERLTTAILSDSCDAAGLRAQVLTERLAPVVAGTRTIGRARTLRFAPSLVDQPEDPYGDAIDAIDDLGEGELVVIATDRSNDSAFWGELFSAAARGAGAVGVITDGNLRDTDRIAALGFPAFSRSRRPIDFRARLRIVDVDAPVVLGGVRIEAGDLVMADDDGVVVVPRSHEERVLGLARERASRESTVLTELLAGESLRSVWDRHRVL